MSAVSRRPSALIVPTLVIAGLLSVLACLWLPWTYAYEGPGEKRRVFLGYACLWEGPQAPLSFYHYEVELESYSFVLRDNLRVMAENFKRRMTDPSVPEVVLPLPPKPQPPRDYKPVRWFREARPEPFRVGVELLAIWMISAAVICFARIHAQSE